MVMPSRSTTRTRLQSEPREPVLVPPRMVRTALDRGPLSLRGPAWHLGWWIDHVLPNLRYCHPNVGMRSWPAQKTSVHGRRGGDAGGMEFCDNAYLGGTAMEQ